MISPDYKKRFVAEYWQLKIRYLKLRKMFLDWEIGKLDFVPTCSKEVYLNQLSAMQNYLSVLKDRAILENINLSCKTYDYYENNRLTRKKTVADLDKDSQDKAEVGRALLELKYTENKNELYVSMFRSRYKLDEDTNSHAREMAIEKLGRIEDLEEMFDIDLLEEIETWTK